MVELSFAGNADRLFNEGYFQEAIAEYESEIDFYEQMRARYVTTRHLYIQYTAQLVHCYERIGDGYFELGQFDESKHYYLRAIIIRDRFLSGGQYYQFFNPIMTLEMKVQQVETAVAQQQSPPQRIIEVPDREFGFENRQYRPFSGFGPAPEPDLSQYRQLIGEEQDEERSERRTQRSAEENSRSSSNEEAEENESSTQPTDNNSTEEPVPSDTGNVRNNTPINENSTHSAMDSSDYARLMASTEKSLDFCQQLLLISRQLENAGDYTKAFNLLQKRVQLLEELEYDREILAENYFQLGILKETLSQYEDAISFYDKSLSINFDLRNEEVMGIIYYRIGLNMQKSGQLEEALTVLNKGIPYLEGTQQYSLLAEAYFLMGLIYGEGGDFPQAFDYLDQSLGLNEELGAYENIGLIYYQKGEFYLRQNRNDRALLAFEEGLRYLEECQSDQAQLLRDYIRSVQRINGSNVF